MNVTDFLDPAPEPTIYVSGDYVTREEYDALLARLLALELKLTAVSAAVTAPKYAAAQGSGTGELAFEEG